MLRRNKRTRRQKQRQEGGKIIGAWPKHWCIFEKTKGFRVGKKNALDGKLTAD